MLITDFLASSPAGFVAVTGILGLLIGSFLNVVIHRLPIMLEREWQAQCAELSGTEPPAHEAFNLITPRSRCPHCAHPVSALENIPILSYLLLKGRCAACGERISIRYPFVEAMSAVLAAIVAAHFGFGWQAGAALLLTWALIAISMIDADRQLLPDIITLSFLWLGLTLNLAGTFTDIRSGVIGAVGGYLTLWLVFHLFRLATGKEGLGYGDFKLLAMLGAWLGWQSLPLVIVLSSAVGATVGIALILVRGRDRNVPMPFGPYLAAAGWLALLWGDRITQAYLRWAAPGL